MFSSLPILRLPSSVPTLTLPEIPSLPMKFSSPLFRFYRHSPKVLRYLRAIYSLRTSSLQGLSVHYRPSASDHIVKTTLERCGPFSLVVLSQRRSHVTSLSGHSDQNASETFSNKLQLNKVQSSLRQTSAKTTQVRSKAKTS